MLKAIAFGLAVGAGVQAWRAFPPSSPVTGDSVALVFVVGVVCAFLGGLWHGRGRHNVSAHAHAEAHAIAANQVNLAVVVPGAGAGASVSPYAVPTDAAPWIASSSTVPALDGDQLEGFDLSEILEAQDSQTEQI
jgi:hypothetical protein